MDEPVLRTWIQESLPPADFYAERPGRWVAEAGWPPASVESVAFSLLAAEGDGAGRLASVGSAAAAASEPDKSLDLDADQTCGLAAGVWCPNGLPAELAVEQSYDDGRSLLFDTGVLHEPLEILGRPVARLTIACDRPQAHLAVRLCAVAPDGSSTLLSWGALNLTHRNDHELPLPLVAGQRYDVEVHLNALGERVPAGHRLRLAVSSAYWPQLWPSPESVRLTLLADGSSTLELPVRGTEFDEVRPMVRFLSAEESSTPIGTIVESGSRTRERDVGAQSGTASIEDAQSYRAQISATGTDYSHAGTDRWTIRSDDPLSAQARCHRTIKIDREGWRIRVETQSSLTCDADQFLLDNEVVAFEGDQEVFRKTFRTKVPRDGV
jgi:predicted acyl esterase